MKHTAVALHIEAQGCEETVVLSHGFGGSARNFRPQARALRDRYRVVLFDARGHARSEAPEVPEAYEPECFVDDVHDVLERLRVDRAVVGGLSMGAAVALRFALTHPQRVRGLVLAAPPPGRSRDDSGWATGLADAIERAGLDAAGAEYVWGPRSGLDPGAAALVRQGFLEHPPHALVHTLRRLLAPQPSVSQLAERLTALSTPTLIVVGSRDALSLPAARELEAALPQGRLVVIQGAGHVVNLAAPVLFNDALRNFLDGLQTQ